MKICKECGGIAEWNSYYGGITCTRCGCVEKPKPTHYSLLIRKSPEEIAEYIRVFFPEVCPPGNCPGEDYCYKCWLDWLNAEVNETEE